MPSFKIGNAIVCEYVVEGSNGKHTIINTYSGDILVSEFPAKIAVAFYIELIPTKFYKGPINITLLLNKIEVMRGEAEIELDPAHPAVMAIPTGFVQIDGPLKMKMMIGVPGEKITKATETKIGLNLATQPIA